MSDVDLGHEDQGLDDLHEALSREGVLGRLATVLGEQELLGADE
ncbi:hypothetical protein OOK43_02265 [[Kitasatospora] papulosa]|nr:hypothetical protein [[Kitasatospora] papulosa]MCX4412107.1 hypothetical protein [[Kitasatospora] papulosa]